ncbi:unnamed protein product, partial [Discosporangium mesarthrocarpum]
MSSTSPSPFRYCTTNMLKRTVSQVRARYRHASPTGPVTLAILWFSMVLSSARPQQNWRQLAFLPGHPTAGTRERRDRYRWHRHRGNTCLGRRSRSLGPEQQGDPAPWLPGSLQSTSGLPTDDPGGGGRRR